MRKIIVTEYLTLDGIMEEPGVWSFKFWSDEAAQFKYEELFASGAMLLGRLTYEGFAKAWPTMQGTGDFGERMNSMPKYVVSSTLQKLEWTNSSLLKGDFVAEISRLKQQDGQNILVAGSAKLVGALLQHNLVDELRLMVHPVVLGSGKRLFADKSQLKYLAT